MNTITLDFETLYHKKEYSVSKLGNWRYTHDPRFDAYMLSAFDGEQDWVGNPKEFNWEALRGARLLAHNAAFERAIIGRLVEDGIVPAWVLQNEWQCTANLSSYLVSVRSLADAVFAFEHRRIDKGMRDAMNGKTWAQAQVEGIDKQLEQYALSDSKESWNIWNKYGDKWPTFERNLSELTMRQCSRGVAINTELLDEYISILADVIDRLVKDLPWTKAGKKPTSPIAIAEECRKCGIPAPPVKTHDEEGFNAWETTYGPKFSWVYAAGQWRSLGKLLSSLETIKERLRPDGTIDFSLLYFGAHTGRWSGGGSGLNFQNFRKIPLFIKDRTLVAPPVGLSQSAFADWIAACTDYQLDIRRLIIPRPGKKMISSDLSQIEPRVLAWLVNDQELLRLLATGMSIYEAFARVHMGWTGGNLKKENADRYALAKIQVLGLGYGCGWEKFITIAAGYGVTLDELQSRATVSNFRDTNKKIVGLWDTLDKQFRRSCHDTCTFGLPSGRELNYRKVERVPRLKKNNDTGKPEIRMVFTAMEGLDRKEYYGGKLTENLVQATARDVFGEHLLTLEDQVGDVLFSVHDEAVMEVEQDVTSADVEHAMSQCPEWIAGLPVGAEAKELQYYTK